MIKKVLKILLVVVGVLVVLAIIIPTEEKTIENTPTEEVKQVEKKEPKKEAVVKLKVPREYTNALKTAQRYADNMYMSKMGIFDQLVSPYGEKFTKEAAKYAVDNLKVNFKENALKTAQRYADTMSMSNSAIFDQLVSPYGEKFTREEAQYAIDNLDK